MGNFSVIIFAYPLRRLWVYILGMANMSIEVAIRIMSNVASPISKQLIELFIWGLKRKCL